jgi:hypothetical protein
MQLKPQKKLKEIFPINKLVKISKIYPLNSSRFIINWFLKKLCKI